jgi:HAD superfamily hydrolase (TIGR01549 family)
VPRDPKNGPRKIRAVLFDMGGTLVEDRDFEAFTLLAEQLGIPAHPDDLAEAVRWGTTEFDRPEHEPDRVAYWKAVLSRAAKTEISAATASQFLDRLRRLPRVPHLFSDVRRCLERLKRDGRALGVVSNSWSEESVREALGRARVLGFFSAIVSSGTEGVSKPDPEIFRRAAARVGVRVDEAFYVGDLPYTDAKAAASAGLRSVWLNRDGDGFGEDPPEITCLSELPKLISRSEAALVK